MFTPFLRCTKKIFNLNYTHSIYGHICKPTITARYNSTTIAKTDNEYEVLKNDIVSILNTNQLNNKNSNKILLSLDETLDKLVINHAISNNLIKRNENDSDDRVLNEINEINELNDYNNININELKKLIYSEKNENYNKIKKIRLNSKKFNLPSSNNTLFSNTKITHNNKINNDKINKINKNYSIIYKEFINCLNSKISITNNPYNYIRSLEKNYNNLPHPPPIFIDSIIFEKFLKKLIDLNLVFKFYKNLNFINWLNKIVKDMEESNLPLSDYEFAKIWVITIRYKKLLNQDSNKKVISEYFNNSHHTINDNNKKIEYYKTSNGLIPKSLLISENITYQNSYLNMFKILEIKKNEKIKDIRFFNEILSFAIMEKDLKLCSIIINQLNGNKILINRKTLELILKFKSQLMTNNKIETLNLIRFILNNYYLENYLMINLINSLININEFELIKNLIEFYFNNNIINTNDDEILHFNLINKAKYISKVDLIDYIQKSNNNNNSNSLILFKIVPNREIFTPIFNSNNKNLINYSLNKMNELNLNLNEKIIINLLNNLINNIKNNNNSKESFIENFKNFKFILNKLLISNKIDSDLYNNNNNSLDNLKSTISPLFINIDHKLIYLILKCFKYLKLSNEITNDRNLFDNKILNNEINELVNLFENEKIENINIDKLNLNSFKNFKKNYKLSKININDKILKILENLIYYP